MSIRDLVDVIESFGSRETAPDVLFLGDSVYMCTSSHDAYAESLANMLVRKCEVDWRARAFACGAFHGDMFLEILDRVLRKPHQPQAVVLPVNIRSLSPQWFFHPAYQFERTRAALQEYDERGNVGQDFEIRYPSRSDFSAYDRVEHSFFGRGKCHLGEFRRLLETRPTTPEEAANRKRAIFTFFYLNEIQRDHPLLQTWQTIAQRLADRGVHLFAYLTPINRGCGDKYVGGHFSNHVAQNVAEVGETFATLRENRFVHFEDWCLDFGPDLFVYDENPDEHLKYEGREVIADRIRTWLDDARSLATKSPCHNVAPENEKAGSTIVAKASGEAGDQRAAAPDCSVFQEWLDLNSVRCNRLYYRDQSAQTLSSLVRLAREHRPSVVVELGTLAGLSLRAWVSATDRAKIFAVDLSFKALHETARFLPVDVTRVTLLEQNILDTDFSAMWGPDDRVILFVDAHDLPNVPIMEHVLTTALPSLPNESLVVVDDLWYSEHRLTQSNARGFLEDCVVPQIDELQCFEGHFAPYHHGGSFMGFAEVRPLLSFVNQHGIELLRDDGSKHVRFIWSKKRLSGSRPDLRPTGEQWGSVQYNPLACISPSSVEDEVIRHLVCDYRRGKINDVAKRLESLLAQYPKDPGLAYGLAVCLARAGRLAQARDTLGGCANRLRHPRRKKLFDDLVRRVGPGELLEPEVLASESQEAGLTIFAVPKAFAGHIATIQKNAIRSWARLRPAPEILLFGDEPGIVEMAREVGAKHIPEVGRNEFGTPRVDALFEAAQQHASHEVLTYVNADMILFQDFVRAAQRVHAEMPDFLLIGQRWDLSVIEEMDFNNPQWRELLHRQIREHGMLHAECGLDYFIFSRHLYQAIPPFAIGRTAWDNWLVKDPYTRGVPVIDGTECITAVHQDHDYGHLDGGRREAWRGAEAKRNRSLLGPAGNMGRTSAAPWVLSKAGTLTKLGPREETFLTTAYRKARSIWLLREAKRLVDADRTDLAACKCEEARELLDIWLTPRLSNKLPAQPAERARAVELYVLSFASLAQCYVQMGRPKQAVTMYTRILENPWLHLPEARRDRIARLRDRVAPLAGVSAARRLSGPKEPPTTQTSTDDAPVELRPKVTVITTCYNAAPYLPDCLDSILAQSFGDWELLLLDDGSTDGTRAIIKQYEARDRRIRSCFFDEKQGPYVRRNYAIGQARADFIVIHDADDLMDRDKLNALHVAISQDSRLGVVGSFYRMFLDGHPELDHTDDIILSKSHEEILQRYRAEGICDFCPHGVAIIRKQLFELIGPYDENPFGADSLWIAKVLEYALQTGEVRVQNRPEFLTLRRMHLESQTGRVPSFDPRSPRPRYWQHVVGKLEHVIRNLNVSSHVDVAAELRRVTGKSFFEANEHLFEQWRNAPVTREIEQHFVSVIRTRFNKGQFVLCVMACEVVERLAEGIARRTPLYDYCRGLAYFCLGLTTQSREYLEREIEAHGTGQARAFLGRYLERYDKSWTRGDRLAFVRQAVSGDPREARGDDGAAFPKLEAPVNDHDVEAALAALERRYRALPDETAGKQAVAVRLSELCQRVGLTEKSVELRDEAKALRRRRGGDAQCVSQIAGGAAG